MSIGGAMNGALAAILGNRCGWGPRGPDPVSEAYNRGKRDASDIYERELERVLHNIPRLVREAAEQMQIHVPEIKAKIVKESDFPEYQEPIGPMQLKHIGFRVILYGT